MTDTGNLTIDRVQSAKTAFLEVLSAKRSLELDITSCEEIDLSGLQLLVSLLRSSLSGSGKVSFRGAPAEAFNAVLLTAGVIESPCGTAEEVEEKIKAVL